MKTRRVVRVLLGFITACWIGSGPATGALVLGGETVVQAAGVDLIVPGYSVPSFVDWDADGLNDLVIGEGGGSQGEGKVRVYLNVGSTSSPAFSGYSYVQSNGSDLVVAASGCLGVFPRVVYWDGDDRKDLLVGESAGFVRIFLNTGTDQDPEFDGGSYLQMGLPGEKVDIDVGSRATPIAIDWDNDERKDLLVGAVDGRMRIYLNAGTNDQPDFLDEQFAQTDAGDLIVPSGRSSPAVADLDDDGRKDVLTGNTEGRVLVYSNSGSDEAPHFSEYDTVESCGLPIDLPGLARSRPYLCDWTGDGWNDLLVGGGDGLVRLFEGVDPATVEERSATPKVLRITGLAPNPTRGVQRIDLSLAEDGRVVIGLVDVAGRNLLDPVQLELSAGERTLLWNPVARDGKRLPSGLYFLRLESRGGVDARPFVIAR